MKSVLRVDNGKAAAAMRLDGESPAIQEALRLVGKLARSQAAVYISGESGTGKEQAARMIHEQSARAERLFIPVNCGAIPETLMESEFFGYRKGAFTGADSDRDGFFQQANGGTLFLDEVADLPLTMQVKLLRAIQERKCVAWATLRKKRWMCASSARRTRIWRRGWMPAASARICTTG